VARRPAYWRPGDLGQGSDTPMADQQREDAEGKERGAIITAAKAWIGTPYLWAGDSKKGIDCSHFFHRIYAKVVDSSLPYMTTGTLKTSSYFVDTQTPRTGDMVLWDGHVGIVVDPQTGAFIGAQSSGVGIANNKTNSYWKKRAGRKFRRHTSLLH
jgi:cell wall-associated NlpC family hydrolase